MDESPSRNAWGLAVAILMVGGAVAGALYITRSAPDAAVLSGRVASVKADRPEVPLGLVLYTDLNCEFCRHFYQEVWLPLQEKYVASGRLEAEVKLFPIGKLYGEGSNLVELAYCAGEQGQFEEVLRLAFPGGQLLPMEELVRKITESVADQGQLQGCVEGGNGSVLAGQATREAVQVGVTAVPAIGVGGVVYEDLVSLEQAEAVVEQALSQAGQYE